MLILTLQLILCYSGHSNKRDEIFKTTELSTFLHIKCCV